MLPAVPRSARQGGRPGGRRRGRNPGLPNLAGPRLPPWQRYGSEAAGAGGVAMRLDGVVGLGGMQRLSGPRGLGDTRRLGGVRGRHRSTIAAVALTLLAPLVLVAVQRTADASTLPSGFRDTVVLSGMNNPTVMQFAPDGRIFVGQKNGVIKVFQSLTDTAPVTFADLSTEVDDYWDRGLLGLALDPAFPASPYVYVLYAYDAPIGGTEPTWNDACPTPPGPTTDGCLVSARVSRLQISGNVMTGSEQVLVNDWCQQFPSHSIGTLLFGSDGYLYVSGGDGASFNNVDYGQYGANYAGDQANPCGDPPGAVGTALTPPGAE